MLDDKTEEVSLTDGNTKPVQPVKPQDKIQDRPTSELAKLVSNATSDIDVVDIISKASPEQLIPWEDTTLPSKGLYYGWTSGVVQVKAWSAKIDKILATARLAQTGQSIDYMLKECCRFPDGFDIQDMLVGDQIYLLYYLRGITHGNEYEFITTCPNQQCQQASTNSVDLNELVNTIVWADESLGTEPFKISLPYLTKTTGREISASIRFLRVRDASGIQRAKKAQSIIGGASRAKIKPRDRIAATANHNRDEIALDDIVTQNIETVIVDIMGVTDRFKIRNIVSKMHSTDLAVIREWLQEHTPSIETMIEIQCANCGETHSAMLPITESFFRPQVPRSM
ncbi:MAG: hypothetical protein M0R50_06870 [Candidatus Cloacimonetes bacterium]|jgi:hypothetical protein|nr:hypothetical protein [Candidatus Cloacimonadota bacterium]